MRLTEIFRLVWLNLAANKTKVILTSTGIIVGAATIMLVVAIGTGGRAEVAEQFKNLNAGAIDISYEYQGNGRGGQGEGGFGGGMNAGPPSGNRMGGGFSGSMPAGGSPFGEQMQTDQRGNTENITLSQSDMEDLEAFVPGIASATMSFTTTSAVDGGTLENSVSITIAGVRSNYAGISNLEVAIGEFLTDENDEYKEKVCVLGFNTAKKIFGSAYDAYDGTVYIDGRPYTVSGILGEMGTVASGISPDDAIFISYNTGVKYLASTSVSPIITLIAEDVNEVEDVMAYAEEVLAESYPNAQFTISDAGSKMEAASKSNDTLTLLLICMAVIVFAVGGIGIMNVLFVSVKERTNEIGILKAIGCSKRDILLEFLLEACCISMIGAFLGVLAALGITPILQGCGVRVDLSVTGSVLSLFFGIVTGTVFGFYPAWQASNLLPVTALNHE